MNGLPVEDVTAGPRTKLEHRIAPRVGQLTVADGRRLLLIIRRIHHQCEHHNAVTASDSRKRIEIHSRCIVVPSVPLKRQFVVTNGDRHGSMEDRIHCKLQHIYAVATRHG